MESVNSVKTIEELNALEQSGQLRGLFEMPNSVYHAGPGISSTGLKEIIRSPAHYKLYQETERQTEAMINGSLIHLAILESKVFLETVAIAPKIDRRTNAGKAAWAEFEAENEGKTIINVELYEALTELTKSTFDNPLARSLLLGEHTEVSVFWTDEETGVLCKARADHINGDTIVDLKSCQDAQFSAFQRSIAQYKYHLSAAYYLDGFATVLDVKNFAWLAVEKAKPYGCRFYAADRELIDAGRDEYRKALRMYAECREKKQWPAYEPKFENMTLPNWYSLEG